MNEEALKEAFKEALKEWMDEKFATFGKWTLTSLGLMIFCAAIYLIGRFHLG